MTSDIQQIANRLVPFVHRTSWERQGRQMICTLAVHVVARDPQGKALDVETWAPCSDDHRCEIAHDIAFDGRRWNYLLRKNKVDLENEADVEIRIGVNSMARLFHEYQERCDRAGIKLHPVPPRATMERMDAIADLPEEEEP